MSHVVIIGCGVVGAAIAYELSCVSGLKITVLDKQPPAAAATKAALGVLMGVISHKTKGNAWRMRQASLQRYETLIPELEALTGKKIPFNRQGILMLLRQDGNKTEEIAAWQKLATTRCAQGLSLEIWDNAQLKSRCPHLDSNHITEAVYSPHDRQVDPVALTLALVAAAQANGVTFKFDTTYLKGDLEIFSSQSQERSPLGTNLHTCYQMQTTSGQLVADWFVIAAGLGSQELTSNLGQMIEIRPVLGQALHLRLQSAIGNPDFQPVITGNDVHIVPVTSRDYWVGATVEFPTDNDLVAATEKLEIVKQQAIAFCPALAAATVIKSWFGLRPRPEGRAAPIVGHLPGYNNVLLATGHYRNGVLLAPATAQAIRQIIASV